jgi:hypothetical protein
MMPNESAAITMALVLTLWSLGVLAFFGTLVWSRAHPYTLVAWARRHSLQRPPGRPR